MTMVDIRFNSRGLVLALLIGTAFLVVSPVRAQNDKARRSAYESLGGAAGDNQAAKSAARVLDYEVSLEVQADEPHGATLQPVGDALRAQLGLPTGQGLLVVSVRDESPSAQAGLKQNDILLSLADKSLAAAGDLSKQLKAAGKATNLSLKILRAGKPLTLQVRPAWHVTIGPADEKKTEYFIGISIAGIEDALRAQLNLPADQGLLINDVIGGSPAQKAGVKKYDIALEMGGKLINGTEALLVQVQANQDKPTTLKVLRGGQPVTIAITPAVRKVATSSAPDSVRYWILQNERIQLRTLPVQRVSPDNWVTVLANTEHQQRRLEAVEKELKTLREAVEKLTEALKASRANKKN
jgi:serine protease Do